METITYICKMITLYLKESPLGLKYLGKTTGNPHNYSGSGKYWQRHLKKHKFKNKDIITTVLYQNSDLELFKEKALFYSKLYDIINNEEYANLVNESGDGSFGWTHSLEAKEKIKKSSTGRVMSEKTKEILKECRKTYVPSKESIEKGKQTRLLNPYVVTEETKAKISAKLKGIKKPAGFGEKVSIAKKGKPVSKEQKDRLLSYNIGRVVSQETRDKKSLKLKGRKPTTEQLQKQREKICKKIKNIDTGEIFNSVKECAEKTGIKSSTLYSHIYRKNKKCRYVFV